MQKESIYNRMTTSEREVAGVLKKMNIEWSYEHPVFVWDDNGRPRVWAPDFYLSQFGIYLEVCGSKNFNYEYRKRVLSTNGYCVIFLHVFKGAEQWKTHLVNYLTLFLLQRNRTFNTIFEKMNKSL